jgi:dihydropteroate synthase
VHILGVLNVTRDSFSDGGRYLAVDAAVAHARALVAAGAAFVDIGAESTHPDAEDVPADVEIARLVPVIRTLRADGVRISVDAYKPAVLHAVLPLGVDIINDVTALRDPEAVAVLRDSAARVILMHSTAENARPARADVSPDAIWPRILDFFRRRIDALTTAGLACERLILDPGMGFFLGRDPRVSLTVLRQLPRLAELGLPLCVSTSRKSFIGHLLGPAGTEPGRYASVQEPRPVDERGAGTLATELWAARLGVDYIRTHDVRALRDALCLWNALEHEP